MKANYLKKIKPESYGTVSLSLSRYWIDGEAARPDLVKCSAFFLLVKRKGYDKFLWADEVTLSCEALQNEDELNLALRDQFNVMQI